MVISFCSKCSTKVPEDAYFCPKCGTKTAISVQAGVSSPYEEMREAFVKIGQEMEKAFGTARKNIEERTGWAPKVCPNCGEKNPHDSRFCFKCGDAIS